MSRYYIEAVVRGNSRPIRGAARVRLVFDDIWSAEDLCELIVRYNLAQKPQVRRIKEPSTDESNRDQPNSTDNSPVASRNPSGFDASFVAEMQQ